MNKIRMVSSGVYTLVVSNAIACAMQLDEQEIRRNTTKTATYKNLRSGYRITGTLDELASLAYHMTRESGWDMSSSAITACNRRAKQIEDFIKAERARLGAIAAVKARLS